MANEATIITLLGNQGDPIEYTVATGTAIAKGTIMNLHASPQTATAADTDGDYVVGIAAVEKTATDGITQMTVWTEGIFKMIVGANSTTIGYDVVASAGDNTIDDYDTLDDEKGFVIGKALEAAATGESCAVKLKL